MTKDEFIQLIAEEIEERARLDALDMQDEYVFDDDEDYWDNHTLSRDERYFDDYQDNLWED